MKNHIQNNIFIIQGLNLQRKLLNKTVIRSQGVRKEKHICSQATCRKILRLDLTKEFKKLLAVTVILLSHKNYLLKKINAGKTSYVPFYNSEEEEESPPSSEDEDSSRPRWCTVRKNINLNLYGKATAYIGLPFSKKTGENLFF
jgi:hypothetical protein